MNFTLGKRLKEFITKRIQIVYLAFKKRFSNENIRTYSEYYDKENVVRTYHENGEIKSLAFVENGKYNGICTTFDEKGQIISRENYKDGNLDGTSVYFFIGTEIIEYEKFFYKGILVSYKKFDKHGNVVENKVLHKL
ncbi:MAG TPA: hypothetical protein PK887_09785 [Ignavibacteriales bacterium]|jgi:antitoxin component YwqK of YwqJK toxin-antitoxin module|nr:hypothetical protein [Ignavibacteriales bacterium]